MAGRMFGGSVAALWWGVLGAFSAMAQEDGRSDVSAAPFELRLGVYGHDLTVGNSGTGDIEDGENIAIEAVIASPAFLAFLGKPRPYAQYSWNVQDETHFGGLGLVWQTPVWRNRVFGEFGLGLVIHDGVIDLPEDRSDPAFLDKLENRVLFGSRELFRTTFAAGYRISDDWDAMVVFEHLSHGQILGDGRNQGLDNIGLRFSRRFGQ